MKIESLSLDFLSLIIHINITKAQNISEHIREGRKKKKKKTRRTQVVTREPSRATQAVRCPGRATPGLPARDLGRALPGSCMT